jgi:flagellar FliL protein
MSSTITPPRAGDGGRDLADANPAKGKGKDKAAKKGEAAGGKKKKVVALVLVVVLAGGGYFFLGRKGAAPDAPPTPGTVLKLDSITLNLAGGHYLKLTLALQFTKAASGGGEGGSDLDGSKALDLAIAQLSNRNVAELNTAATREAAKAKLRAAVEEAYHHGVMDLYFTEFVMQ